MSKDNPKINNQNDIDNYINQLIKQAESEIETLFSRRLKQIRQEIADMFEKYQSDDVYVTWTEFNKYNRLNKELIRIGEMLTEDYREVAKLSVRRNKTLILKSFDEPLFV